MARLLFFGKLADVAGERLREVSVQGGTIDSLVSSLAADDAVLGAALNEKSVRYVVNEAIVGRDTVISDDDEIAFLPPVSGG